MNNNETLVAEFGKQYLINLLNDLYRFFDGNKALWDASLIKFEEDYDLAYDRFSSALKKDIKEDAQIPLIGQLILAFAPGVISPWLTSLVKVHALKKLKILDSKKFELKWSTNLDDTFQGLIYVPVEGKAMKAAESITGKLNETLIKAGLEKLKVTDKSGQEDPRKAFLQTMKSPKEILTAYKAEVLSATKRTADSITDMSNALNKSSTMSQAILKRFYEDNPQIKARGKFDLHATNLSMKAHLHRTVALPLRDKLMEDVFFSSKPKPLEYYAITLEQDMWARYIQAQDHKFEQFPPNPGYMGNMPLKAYGKNTMNRLGAFGLGTYQYSSGLSKGMMRGVDTVQEVKKYTTWAAHILSFPSPQFWGRHGLARADSSALWAAPQPGDGAR